MKNSIKREHENFRPKGKLTNEDIIQSARRQRHSVNSRMSVEAWQGRRSRSGLVAAAVGIAASLVGFLVGFSLHAYMPQPAAPLETQVIQVQHDTILQVQTVRDTIYQMRIVTKFKEPTLAEQDDTPPEQKACSMLCDDIPYELLAAGR